MSEIRLQSETSEYPVSFQSFRQPAVNPYRFRGKGSAAIHEGLLGIEGSKSIPFWFSRRATEIVALENIFDVATAGRAVTFRVEQRKTASKVRTQVVKLFFEDEGSARAFATALPARLSEQASRERAETAEFNANLLARAKRPILVPALVAANVIVYALLGTKGVGWIRADFIQLIGWGSNFGPLTTGGEWWRLATSMFLHGGFVHLFVNMFTLWDTGRLSEQLYGRARFSALYVASGLLGSAASVWWNPYVNSVGASGAIFGVYGALLAFMLDKRNGVPATIMSTHIASIVLFIGYNVFNGIAKTGIDNAAHLGGLAGGMVLGWAFARPLDPARSQPRVSRPLAGAAVTLVAIAALLALTPNTRGAYDAHRAFVADIGAMSAEERRLIAGARTAVARAGMPGARREPLEREFLTLADGWSALHQRFASHRLDHRVSNDTLMGIQADLLRYTELRGGAMKALATAATARGPEQAHAEAESIRMWKESDAVLQRINDRSKGVSGKKDPR